MRAGRESYLNILESHIRLYIKPGLGGQRLTTIRPVDCDNLWEQLLQRLSRKTVTQTRSALKLILFDAARNDLLMRNVAALSRLPRLHSGDHSQDQRVKAKERMLSKVEINALISWLVQLHRSGSAWAAPTLVAVYTGARRGEIAGLRWCDIDFQTGIISFNGQLLRIRGAKPVQWERRFMKSAAAQRNVMLEPFVLEILKAMPAPVEATSLLFDINPDAWGNWWTKTCAPALNLPTGKTIHGIRHSHASILLDEGQPEEEVARRLGHSSSLTTRRSYSHPVRDDASVSAAFGLAVGESQSQPTDAPREHVTDLHSSSTSRYSDGQ